MKHVESIHLVLFLVFDRPLSENTAAVMIYFKKKNVIDAQKTPLMPFNELLGNFYYALAFYCKTLLNYGFR